MAILKPKGNDLKSISDFNSEWADRIALLILVGLAVDSVAAFASNETWRRALTIAANLLIGAGVWGELWFLKRARQADDGRVAEANKLAAEANDRAAQADLARTKLEAQLQPRMLNQEQWDFIQSLRGKFEQVNIAFETDAETRWFANDIMMALMAAGMKVAFLARAPDVHSFGMFVYDPKGFDGARPKSVEPLVEIFRKSDPIPALAVIGTLPTDILLAAHDAGQGVQGSLLHVPMIFVGGRFMVPPANRPSFRPKPKVESP